MLKLDKLLLIPASIPPHKDLPAGSATTEHRLEMTRMAGEQLGLGSKVETLDMEVRRAGKSFTSDTLAELKAQFPEDELWLLMGTDMFLSFETWHEPEKIASLAGIAAFGRTKADMELQFSAQRDKLYRLYPDARIFTLTVPGVIDISSTELRERLASGTGENLLPPAVYGYILRNHLYGTDVNLKSLTLSQLRPVALSYLKYKRIPHVLGTEQEAIRLATPLRRGCGEGPCSGAAPRLHEEAGYAGATGPVPSVRHRAGRAGAEGTEACFTLRPARPSPGRCSAWTMRSTGRSGGTPPATRT
ncbi:MAG: nicotinate-nicotinamide nucleotide adenylyltransferase [Dysosmobacter sp.]